MNPMDNSAAEVRDIETLISDIWENGSRWPRDFLAKRIYAFAAAVNATGTGDAAEHYRLECIGLAADKGSLQVQIGELRSALAAANHDRATAIKELGNQIAYNEGYQEHIGDLLNAMKPFVVLVKDTDGRIPSEKLSFADWHTLAKAFDYTASCLDSDEKIIDRGNQIFALQNEIRGMARERDELRSALAAARENSNLIAYERNNAHCEIEELNKELAAAREQHGAAMEALKRIADNLHKNGYGGWVAYGIAAAAIKADADRAALAPSQPTHSYYEVRPADADHPDLPRRFVEKEDAVAFIGEQEKAGKAWVMSQPTPDADLKYAREQELEAKEAMSHAFFLVTGRSVQWSDDFGYAEAMDEIRRVMTQLRTPPVATTDFAALREREIAAAVSVDPAWNKPSQPTPTLSQSMPDMGPDLRTPSQKAECDKLDADQLPRLLAIKAAAEDLINNSLSYDDPGGRHWTKPSKAMMEALLAAVSQPTPDAGEKSVLRKAIDYVNENHPLPRCVHGQALRDHSGEALEPPCGCSLRAAGGGGER